MPRNKLQDFLQSHYFWAFDASTKGFPVFNPLFGFSKISSPQISAETESFKDGTYLYNRQIIKGGSVSSVVFERAASMFDSDFYDWIMFALTGGRNFKEGEGIGRVGALANEYQDWWKGSPRRNILVVQFTGINAAALGTDAKIGVGIAAAAAAGAFAIGGFSGTGSLVFDLAKFGVAGAGLAAASGASTGYSVGPFQFATRIPARAWVLNNCIPVRYKAASDFDANNASISLQELEVQPEYIEEFSLGLKP